MGFRLHVNQIFASLLLKWSWPAVVIRCHYPLSPPRIRYVLDTMHIHGPSPSKLCACALFQCLNLSEPSKMTICVRVHTTIARPTATNSSLELPQPSSSCHQMHQVGDNYAALDRTGWGHYQDRHIGCLPFLALPLSRLPLASRPNHATRVPNCIELDKDVKQMVVHSFTRL